MALLVPRLNQSGGPSKHLGVGNKASQVALLDGSRLNTHRRRRDFPLASEDVILVRHPPVPETQKNNTAAAASTLRLTMLQALFDCVRLAVANQTWCREH